MKQTIKQKTEKLYLLSHTLREIVKDRLYSYCTMTETGKTIPTEGSRVIDFKRYYSGWISDAKCTKVIMHADGTLTGVFDGLYLRFYK